MSDNYPEMPTKAELETADVHLADLQVNFVRLRTEAAEDCKPINQADLNLNDFNKSALEIKWLNYRADYKADYQKQISFQKKMYRELFEFYTFDYNLKLNREQINTFIETDDRFGHIMDRALVLENIVDYCIDFIVDYCSDLLERLKNKGFEVKNYIEYNKWMAGFS